MADELDLTGLDAVAALPVDASERRAWDEDPHRRALLREYLAFVASEPAVGSRAGEASERLGAFLHENIAQPRQAPIRAGRFLRWQPALAVAAAVAAVAVGLSVWSPETEFPPALRGPAADSIVLSQPVVAGDVLVFDWTAPEVHEQFSIVFYDLELNEIHRSGPVEGGALRVSIANLPAGFSGQEVYVRVLAVEGTSVLDRSSMATVRLP